VAERDAEIPAAVVKSGHGLPSDGATPVERGQKVVAGSLPSPQAKLRKYWILCRFAELPD
jgi:hypothetical protein